MQLPRQTQHATLLVVLVQGRRHFASALRAAWKSIGLGSTLDPRN
jgi:hypothetical protein